jgi:hypothetical protein
MNVRDANMIFRPAHLLCLLFAVDSAASGCGVASDSVRLQTVAPGGEIVLADGRRARFGGLWLAPQANDVLAAEWAEKPLGIALLAPRPDRWGRLIVDFVDASGHSLALDLLQRGLARVRPEAETSACEAERLDAEAAARTAGEGVWGRNGAVLDAGDAAALAKADGRFVLVSGVVRRVGGARAKVYLDFAGRGGFAVVVARKAEPQFRRVGVDLTALAGQRVLVRGVLDDRFGPRIEIADPAMIEPLQ